MPNDPDPNYIESTLTVSFELVFLVISGMFLWDFITSIGYEWQFISGKLRARWPMLFYFVGRYLSLFSLIGFIIVVTRPVYSGPNLRVYILAIYAFFELLGVFNIGLASMNLAIRVIAIWEYNMHYLLGMFILIAALWALIITSFVCAILDANRLWRLIIAKDNNPLPFSWDKGPSEPLDAQLYMAISVVAMSLDLVILSTLWHKLSSFGTPGLRTSRVLLRDGIMYFFASLALNTSSVVLSAVALGADSIIGKFSYGTIISGVLSTMVASRAVRHLSTHLSRSDAILLSGTQLFFAPVEDIIAAPQGNQSASRSRNSSTALIDQAESYETQENTQPDIEEKPMTSDRPTDEISDSG